LSELGSASWEAWCGISTKTRSPTTRLKPGWFTVQCWGNKKKYANTAKESHKQGGDYPSVIIIMGGYGVGEYKFNYCLIDETAEFLIENLICVELVRRTELTQTSWSQNIKILSSLKTKEQRNLSRFTSEQQSTEMGEILPIYMISNY
jgi:hypothetical protein